MMNTYEYDKNGNNKRQWDTEYLQPIQKIGVKLNCFPK